MVCFHTIYFGCHSFYAVFSTKSKFQSIVGNNSTLHWFCFKSPCDWFRKIAPRFQSIRCKAKPVAACSSAFSRALGCALLWLAVGITLIRFYDTQCKGASFAQNEKNLWRMGTFEECYNFFWKCLQSYDIRVDVEGNLQT